MALTLMPSRIVPAQTSRSGPVRASVALRGLAGAAHACGAFFGILQNPLQHSLKLGHSHRAVAAGLLWPGKIRYFASQNRARSTRRPSSSTGSARLQTCSVERDASRRRGRHNKNSDNGRERPQSQRLERLRPEPVKTAVRGPGSRKHVWVPDGIEAEPRPEGVGLRRGFAKGFAARLQQDGWIAPVVDDVPRFQ